jgi:radical SAM/Cys-rich protein
MDSGSGLTETKALADFDTVAATHGVGPLHATGVTTLQINFGKLCNQSCRHCHVDAGPARREMIGRVILEGCRRILATSGISTVDMTGGAPELNPHFRWFAEQCRALGCRITVRSNLTVLFEPGQETLAQFYRRNALDVVASLPYFTGKIVDSQRGAGVFARSIEAIRLLNSLGYAQDGSGLTLDLVYNPAGAFLPPAQASIEADFKRELDRRCGIRFNRLLTIANMPIGRFREFLIRDGLYQGYMNRLAASFNPAAAAAVMCKTTLSVDWTGAIFDCDFNQMLGMNVNHGAPSHVQDFDLQRLQSRRIVTGNHCLGCTAGAGSSCGGALVGADRYSEKHQK